MGYDTDMYMFVVRFLAVSFALLLAAEIVPGVTIDSVITAFIAALVLGLLNTFVKPILIFLTLPITIITLGLFLLVINTALVGLAAYLLPGFGIAGFLEALGVTLIVTLVSVFVNRNTKSSK